MTLVAENNEWAVALKEVEVGSVLELPSLAPGLSPEPVVCICTSKEVLPGTAIIQYEFEASWYGIAVGSLKATKGKTVATFASVALYRSSP